MRQVEKHMLRGVNLIIVLLSFVTHHAHGSVDNLVDKFINKLFDRTLNDRILKESLLHNADVDRTTNAKPAMSSAQQRGNFAMLDRSSSIHRARSDNSHHRFKSSGFQYQPWVLQRRSFLHAAPKGNVAPLPAAWNDFAHRWCASAKGHKKKKMVSTKATRSSTMQDSGVSTNEKPPPTKPPRKSAPAAVQIVEVNTKSDEVTVNKDGLQLIQDNLQAAGVDRVSIVSVMGAYRTGKSFLLDLMLRYMENPPSKEESLDSATPREKGDFEVPAWLKKGGNLDREEGFTWREGQDRITQGVWIWSKPYVRETTVMEDGEEKKVKMGVLLMDTQGAWDSQMTPQQSATIFGLTTALSSKQVFNIQNRIGEDNLKAMDYFANMAVAAERLIEQEEKAKEQQAQAASNVTANVTAVVAQKDAPTAAPMKPFQELQILVRDWVNFDDLTWDDAKKRKAFNVPEEVEDMDRWPVDACVKQMDMHFQQHFGADVKDRRAVEDLETMFNKMSAFLLPLPGKNVQKSKRWTGDLADIDEDFLRFMDLFTRKTFTEDIAPQRVMGQYIDPNRFADVVSTLAYAFEGMGFTADSMVEAVGRATNLLGKDAAERLYKKEMDKLFNTLDAGSIPEEELEESNRKAQDIALAEYTKRAIFGDEEEIQKTKEDLQKKIDSRWAGYQRKNSRRSTEGLNVLVPVAAASLGLFGVDRVSDIACDWWLPLCVDLSEFLGKLYTPLFAFCGLFAFVQYSGESTVTTSAAILEFQKELILFSQKQFGAFTGYVQSDETKPIKDALASAAKELGVTGTGSNATAAQNATAVTAAAATEAGNEAAK